MKRTNTSDIFSKGWRDPSCLCLGRLPAGTHRDLFLQACSCGTRVALRLADLEANKAEHLHALNLKRRDEPHLAVKKRMNQNKIIQFQKTHNKS